MNKIKIGNYTFMANKESTFIEYFNNDKSIHTHFNTEIPYNFNEICKQFYINNLQDNKKLIDFVENEKYTFVYYDDLLGIVAHQCKLVDFYIDKYAQYEECLYCNVIFKRKRTIYEQIFLPNQKFLILKGWQNINFDSLYTVKKTEKCTIRSSNVLSFSNKWMQCAINQVKPENIIYYQK